MLDFPAICFARNTMYCVGTMGKYMVNSKVLFLSDNQAVVDVLNKQSSSVNIFKWSDEIQLSDRKTDLPLRD
jgi:hypothetical protein